MCECSLTRVEGNKNIVIRLTYPGLVLDKLQGQITFGMSDFMIPLSIDIKKFSELWKESKNQKRVQIAQTSVDSFRVLLQEQCNFHIVQQIGTEIIGSSQYQENTILLHSKTTVANTIIQLRGSNPQILNLLAIQLDQ